MSSKSEETLRSSLWRRQTSWESVAVASKMDRLRRELV